MPIPQRPMTPSGLDPWQVLVTDDGSRTLIDPTTRVSFHSGCGAAAETESVYLAGSGVEDRLRSRSECSVLEIGFGLGLGMLMTLDRARQFGAGVRYVGIDRDWLPADVLRQLRFDQQLGHPTLFEQWLELRRSSAELLRGTPPLTIAFDTGDDRADATLVVGEAAAIIEAIDERFDAVYFDPFDPATDAECWRASMFRTLLDRTKPGGRLVTYCVKRRVRDAMESAGWHVRRVAGPVGGKREVAIAERPTDRVSDHDGV